MSNCYIALSRRVTPLDVNAEQLVTARYIPHKLKTVDLAAMSVSTHTRYLTTFAMEIRPMIGQCKDWQVTY